MRRLLRWLANGLCLLSLMACVGAAWLWWKSYRTPPGGECRASVFVHRLRARYTVRSERGLLTLFGPPRPAANPAGAVPKASEPAPGELAAGVSDEQLDWQVARVWPSDRGPSFRTNLSPRGRPGTPTEAVELWLGRNPARDDALRILSPTRWKQAVSARRAALDEMKAPLLRLGGAGAGDGRARGPDAGVPRDHPGRANRLGDGRRPRPDRPAPGRLVRPGSGRGAGGAPAGAAVQPRGRPGSRRGGPAVFGPCRPGGPRGHPRAVAPPAGRAGGVGAPTGRWSPPRPSRRWPGPAPAPAGPGCATGGSAAACAPAAATT